MGIPICPVNFLKEKMELREELEYAINVRVMPFGLAASVRI